MSTGEVVFTAAQGKKMDGIFIPTAQQVEQSAGFIIMPDTVQNKEPNHAHEAMGRQADSYRLQNILKMNH